MKTFHFLGEQVFVSNKEIIYYDVEAKSNDEIFRRITILDKMLEKKYQFIVTSFEAISHKIIPKELFCKNILSFECGSREELGIIIKKLINMGYERTDIVEGKGQFAIRGGILDIFSVDRENPLRIEMFDDEIDSIRLFDTLSQRSIDKLEKVKVLPAKEIIYSNDKRKGIVERIKEDLDKYIKN